MDLVKEEKKKRLTGIITGAILPIVLFLIIGAYGYYFDRPFMASENNFAVGAHSYYQVLKIYLISISYYQVFFSISVNMIAVFYFSNKKQNSIGNGFIVPTAIYALVLVFIRLI